MVSHRVLLARLFYAYRPEIRLCYAIPKLVGVGRAWDRARHAPDDWSSGTTRPFIWCGRAYTYIRRVTPLASMPGHHARVESADIVVYARLARDIVSKRTSKLRRRVAHIDFQGRCRRRRFSVPNDGHSSCIFSGRRVDIVPVCLRYRFHHRRRRRRVPCSRHRHCRLLPPASNSQCRRTRQACHTV